MKKTSLSLKIGFLSIFLPLFCLGPVFSEPDDIQLASLSVDPSYLNSAAIPRISMDMQGAPLRDLLKAFSQQSGLNFIAGEEIQEREVTLYLNDVSVEDALSSIINATGLTYRRLEDSDVFIVVASPEEISTLTRIFKLQYARVTRFNFTLSDSDDGGSESSGNVFPEIELEESDDVPRGLDQVIQEILSENGILVADSRTNSLIVTDTPDQMEIIAETIARLDSRTPQVMIAADILDTTTQVVDDIGFEWGSGSDGEFLSVAGASRGTTFPFNLGIGALTKGSGTAASGITEGTLGFSSLDMTLDLLTQNTETKILARPRILTLANKPALIKLTSDTAIASVDNLASATTGASLTATNTAERIETGISLRVTPQVNDYGFITMLVEPSVVDSNVSENFSQFVDPRTRSSKTTVRVRDGNTIVIGGLISKNNTRVVRKVPVLGDVPMLGSLFSRTDHDDSDRELIMFITPRIIKELEVGFAGQEFVPGGEVEIGLDDWVFPEHTEPVVSEREYDSWGQESITGGGREAEIERAVQRLTQGE